MSSDTFDIHVYVANRDEPYTFHMSIDDLRRKIYSENVHVDGWVPLHRSGKPAIEYSDGGYEWWFNGYLHNIHGPAIYYPSTNESLYYINGIQIQRQLFDIVKLQFQNNYSGTGNSWIKLDDCLIHIVNGILHSDNEPAIVYDNGTKVWFDNGLLSRNDGPAILWSDGAKEYWFNNRMDRGADDFGPVIVDRNGRARKWCIGGSECTQQDYTDHIANYLKASLEGSSFSVSILPDRICIKNGVGELHRPDGPAVLFFNGDREWYIDGKLHRLDGPAIARSNGTTMWYRGGVKHREDGPALEFANGRQVWYLSGKRIRKRDFRTRLQEFRDKEELIETVEALLTNFSNKIPEKDSAVSENEIMNLANELSGIEKTFINFVEPTMPHEPDGPLQTVSAAPMAELETREAPVVIGDDDIGWGIPLISVAAAALLNISKRVAARKRSASPKKSAASVATGEIRDSMRVIETQKVMVKHGQRNRNS